MDFGGPRNHVLDRGPWRIPIQRGNFEGEGVAHCEVQRQSAVSCAKMAEPIEIVVWYVGSGGSKEACIS